MDYETLEKAHEFMDAMPLPEDMIFIDPATGDMNKIKLQRPIIKNGFMKGRELSPRNARRLARKRK